MSSQIIMTSIVFCCAACVWCRHGVTLVLLCSTTNHSLGCMLMCGAELSKIGARPFRGKGVFVLVISYINTGYQKSLTPPLMALYRNENGAKSVDKSTEVL